MGRVVVTFRVMPTDAEVELGPIQEALRSSFAGDLRDLVEKPVAFGLVGLEAVVILDDAEGRLDAAETAIRGARGVGNVETVSVDLV